MCVFCTIINEETELIVAYRPHCFVLLSDPRLVRGHLLVIPRRHVERPSEMTTEEQVDLFDTLLSFQDKILGMAGGCDIRQHCKPFLPESKLKVNHVHFHLLPRELNDALYEKTKQSDELFENLPDRERDFFLERYR